MSKVCWKKEEEMKKNKDQILIKPEDNKNLRKEQNLCIRLICDY